jgi:hypothetical protein
VISISRKIVSAQKAMENVRYICTLLAQAYFAVNNYSELQLKTGCKEENKEALHMSSLEFPKNCYTKSRFTVIFFSAFKITIMKKVLLLSAVYMFMLGSPAYSQSEDLSENIDQQTFNTGSVLWYDTPAKEWEDALPVGNGRLGAMVFGKHGEERIQLNTNFSAVT